MVIFKHVTVKTVQLTVLGVIGKAQITIYCSFCIISQFSLFTITGIQISNHAHKLLVFAELHKYFHSPLVKSNEAQMSLL